MKRNIQSSEARVRFAELLGRLMADGVNARGEFGEKSASWTDNALALALDRKRTKKSEKKASPRAIANWRKAVFLPRDFPPLVAVFYGDPPQDAEAAETLWRAYKQAQAEKLGNVAANVRADFYGLNKGRQAADPPLSVAWESADRRKPAPAIPVEIVGISETDIALRVREHRTRLSSRWPSLTSHLVKGFGRRPEHGGWDGRGAGVRKPPMDETAGRIWRCWGGFELWGFEGHGRVGRIVAGAGGGGSGGIW